MDEIIRHRLGGKNVLILGFGREGKSSYQLIRKVLPAQHITIADKDPSLAKDPLCSADPNLSIVYGAAYLDNLHQYDLILKTPGISLVQLEQRMDPEKITSQTDLFLERYASQVIGVTGTKGKSTTASLTYHLLQSSGIESVLLGNIGSPAFHFAGQITPETRIVFELSSHQLEHVRRSPHIAILLNFFQEHLDAYRSYEDYRLAKMNIALFQDQKDILIYNADDPWVLKHVEMLDSSQSRFPFSQQKGYSPGCFADGKEIMLHASDRGSLSITGVHNRYLKGEHNLRNIQAAVSAAFLTGADEQGILEGLDTFKGLAHRMEYVGFFHGIHFYNDSIATIPEACMAAIKSISDVDTLIAGGFDREIDYAGLAHFLPVSGIRNLILTGPAGRRIGTLIEAGGNHRMNIRYINRFDDFFDLALKYTRPGSVCLLSPAAASYDEFRSFEERGMRFTERVKQGATE